MQMFGDPFKLSCIAESPQVHCRPHLILNLLAKTDKGTLSVNVTTNREVAPELMKFGHALPHILQAIREEDPAMGPVRVSKLDVIDAYHHGTLRPYQVGAFA